MALSYFGYLRKNNWDNYNTAYKFKYFATVIAEYVSYELMAYIIMNASTITIPIYDTNIQAYVIINTLQSKF